LNSPNHFQGCQIFLGTKTPKREKYTKMTTKNTEWPQNIPNCTKINEMSKKLTNISHCKTLQKFSQIGIFGFKIYHLAALISLCRKKTLKSDEPIQRSVFHFLWTYLGLEIA
jgi:N-glycosylase/DNA lyase